MSDVQIPILKDTKDPHYRYKMPKLTIRVEGSGNGIKTVITNMAGIASALQRPASYPTKYFGYELGAQVTMAHNDYIVNGSHDSEKLLYLLYGFIGKFVLCSKCKNPETDLSVENGDIKQSCKACGHSRVLPKQHHKLTTFIVSHPPNSNGRPAKSSSSKKPNSKSGGKSKKTGSHDDTQSPQSGGEHKSPQPTVGDDEDDFDTFEEDELSESAYLELLHSGQNDGLFINDPKKAADVFYKLVKQRKEANELANDMLAAHKELHEEAKLLELKDKATLILGELLLTENILDDLSTYHLLLLRFCGDNAKAQKYLLGAFEKLVGDVYHKELFDISTKILKKMYDLDILDEEVIIEWASKESKKYVSKEMSRKIREKVAPLIKWLKEAEVDSSDEDDKRSQGAASDSGGSSSGSSNGGVNRSPGSGGGSPHIDNDDDDLYEFSHRVSGIQIENVAASSDAKKQLNGGHHVTLITDRNNNNQQQQHVDEDDDIDIDNI